MDVDEGAAGEELGGDDRVVSLRSRSLVGLQKTGVLSAYSLTSAQFDEGSVEVVSPESLPDNWRRYPAPPETQTIGDRWVLEQRSLALQVPSAIIAAESNYLLNPAHPGFASVAISTPVTFAFDERLRTQRFLSRARRRDSHNILTDGMLTRPRPLIRVDQRVHARSRGRLHLALEHDPLVAPE